MNDTNFTFYDTITAKTYEFAKWNFASSSMMENNHVTHFCDNKSMKRKRYIS